MRNGCRRTAREENAMDELTTTTHRSIRPKVWVNAAVLLLLLVGVLLGITQLFIVLVSTAS
jgi:hypothetical protein